MPRSFRLPSFTLKDPKSVLQGVAGLLLALNLAAAWFVWRPLGGSASDLVEEAANLRSQLAQRRSVLQRTHLNVTKVESGRAEGDQFMEGYFLARRTAAATIVSELNAAAKESKIRTKVYSFNEQPIEGSDTLTMMIISGEYEGTYGDLIAFVNRVDRSPRLLIIESLTATPQQGSAGVLNIGVKLEAFVREDSGLPVKMDIPESERAASEAAPAPAQRGPAPAPAGIAPINPGAPPQQAGPPQFPTAAPNAAQRMGAPIPVQPSDADRPSSRMSIRQRRQPQTTEEQEQ